VKKTTAELLIGTWKRVAQQNLPQISPEWDITVEYAVDGKVFIRAKDPDSGLPPLQTGTYRLEGNVIKKIMDPPAKPRDRVVTIESVSEDKLIELGPDKPLRARMEYQRVREEKK